MKAILIARVSTEEQKEAGNSLPAQVARLENIAWSEILKLLKTLVLMEAVITMTE